MKGILYYLEIFGDEFGSRMAYHTSKRSGVETNEEEVKLVRDLGRCTRASDYLDSETFNEMRQALAHGFGDRDLQEFARAAKLGTKVGKKWCVDILILSIQYAREKGTSLIQDATFEPLL